MIRLFLYLFYLAQLAQASSNHTPTSNCPLLDGTSRSVWSILGSCALTLLICVWHTIHFDVYEDWVDTFLQRVFLVLSSFFAPEVVVWVASEEWCNARDKVLRFRDMLSSTLNIDLQSN